MGEAKNATAASRAEVLVVLLCPVKELESNVPAGEGVAVGTDADAAGSEDRELSFRV